MERNQDIRSFPQSRWVSRHFQLEQEITNTSDLDGPFSFSVLSAEVTQEGDTLHAHICCDVFMTPYQLGINWSSWMFDGRRHYLDVLVCHCFLLRTARESVPGTKQ